MGQGIRRCHDCNARYLRVGSSMIRLGDNKRITRAMYLTLAMIVAFVAILFAIAWVARQEAAPALESGSVGAIFLER